MKAGSISKLILALCCLSSAIQAQGEPPENERKKDREAEIAIVALGPKPTRKYSEAKDGGEPVMLLAKPGETPPPRLYYRGEKNADNKSGWTPLNIAFNNPSTLRKVPAGREMKLYQKQSGENEFELYAALPAVPAGMRRIFFLVPSKYGPTPWKESPTLKVLTLENSDLVDQDFILVNFSRHVVLHSFEDKVESVSPNQIITYQREKLGQLYRLAARYGSQKKIIYNTAVRLSHEGHIQLFVLYNGNPKTNAEREVGVFRMTIPAKEQIVNQGAAD